MSVTETIVAAATPAGRSALAIVRVDGPLAASIATAALGRKSPPAEKTSTLGIWRDQSGAPIDQIVAVLWSAGRSFTGNDSLEITCHGNPLLVRRITEDCLARGGRLAEPGEFTRRSYLAGRIDLTQAEAAETVDCKGLHVLPGLIDPHVHLRDPGDPKVETMETGTRAAVLGGLAAVFDMPNTTPSITNTERRQSNN